MANPTHDSRLILSPPLEDKLIAICSSEGLVDLSERGWSHHKEIYDRKQINVGERSHILASLFLHPRVKLKSGYEAPIQIKSDLIEFAQDTAFDFDNRCEDFPLLLSYCKAVDLKLDASKISELMVELMGASEKVVQAWGEMPAFSNDESSPVLFQDLLDSMVAKSPIPRYSQHQLDTYNQYKTARDSAAVVERCYDDLNNIWSRKKEGDALAVHPRLQRTYRRILSAEDFEDGLTENDLFFLSVRALKTLPVGRTLKETLELSASTPGIALRQRVSELHGELQTGGLAAIPKILARIERDADDYRSLTARLTSPHTLSSASDVALGAAGLIPGIGTLFGGATLLKSAFATYSNFEANQKLKNMLWAKYQGRSF